MKTEIVENIGSNEDAIRELNSSTALLITDGPDAKELMGAFLSTHTDTQMVVTFDVAAYVESAPGAFTPIVDARKQQFEFELNCAVVQLGYANLLRTAYNVFAYIMDDEAPRDQSSEEGLKPAYNGKRFTKGSLVMIHYNARSGEGMILQVWGGGQLHQQFMTIPGVALADIYDELGLLARPDDASELVVVDCPSEVVSDSEDNDNAMGAEAEAVEAEDEEAEAGNAENDGADAEAGVDGAADGGGAETDTDEGDAGAVGKVEPVKAGKNIGPIIVDGPDTLRSQPHKVPAQSQKAPTQVNKASMQPHVASAASTANVQSHGVSPAKTAGNISPQTGHATKRQNRAGNGVSFQTK